ncbi:MAG: PASTA domain-containing protein [Bacteroidetes bacterium]|nr:PASTA domain-containing protein [Bacteroidota bacterium]
MLNIQKKTFFNFLRQKKFYLHLGIAVIGSFILLLIVFQIIKWYTFHGEAIRVPDYSGSTISKLDSIDDRNNFRFIVTDSVFDISRASGTVISQNPLPYSTVKRNRKIYLTVVAQSIEMVPMPNLVDLSLRQSLVRLEMSRLAVNILDYVPDFAENAVLAQMYQGDTIYPDSLIQIHSKIDLILGKGYYSRKLLVPFLIGLTKKEAEKKLHYASFNLGEEVYLDQDNNNQMKVYLQEPVWNEEAQYNHGDFMNLWYRSDSIIDFTKHIKSLQPDTTLRMDSILY